MAAVLLIEDDAPHRRALELGLAAPRFDVTAVADGRGAREAVEGVHHHDVILLDLGLPDVDGIDLCRHLPVSPGAPIVVVSSDATTRASSPPSAWEQTTTSSSRSTSTS